MKKLSVLFLSLFALLLISCGQPTQEEPKIEPTTEETTPSIPRSEWDADNIAYTNTAVSPVTSHRWYFERISGTNGIIGEFLNESQQQINNGGTYTHRYTYFFYDTGYFKEVESGFSLGGSPFTDTVNGTFVISRYNDNCFRLTITRENGIVNELYYVVNQNGYMDNSVPFSAD